MRDSKLYLKDILDAMDSIELFVEEMDFEEGCLLAVNLGEDADTTGAIYGQIAGAYYGERGIPEKWRDNLAEFELMDSFVEGLYDGSIDSV